MQDVQRGSTAPEADISVLGRTAQYGDLLAIRTIGSQITVTDEGLFIHAVFRRCQFLPCDTITGFELILATRFDNRFTRSAVAIGVTRSHQRKPVYCIGASFSGPSPAADTMLQALRSEQRHRQPASNTTTH